MCHGLLGQLAVKAVKLLQIGWQPKVGLEDGVAWAYKDSLQMA